MLSAVAHADSQPALASNLWQPVETNALPQAASASWIQPKRFRSFHLNAVALREKLRQAPRDVSPAVTEIRATLTLPMPDGSWARFRLVESPVLPPELAARFSGIKTYDGVGVDDPGAKLTLDWTPSGLHAQILSRHGAVYIDPHFKGNTQLHASYYKRDYQPTGAGLHCVDFPGAPLVFAFPTLPPPPPTGLSLLHTYRLACAATGEYTQFHGGTVTDGLAAIVTAIHRVNGIYEAELGVRFVLVPDNDRIVYTNPNTDPYSARDGITTATENQGNLDKVIGDANYDVGHVLSTLADSTAALGVVCVSGFKAKGMTGSPTPTGDTFYVDFVAHELGHQFHADHTFNSLLGNCGNSRINLAAYEPGSGSTIMAYAGLCNTDDLQPQGDPYFHAFSLEEMTAFISTGHGSECGVTTPTGNTPPTVDAGPSFVIPKGTPFTLTARGNDPDGDSLTYCWEELDLGPAQQLGDADNASSPLFRSYPPALSPSRTFPQLGKILSRLVTSDERLPALSRTMHFRVTARDQRGAYGAADMQVTVDGVAGPFTIGAPNTAVVWSGSRTVTWNVAGTASAPINATRVDILLSTNGGNTFPITLAANTPNDGAETVVLPNLSTSTARIRIQAVGNIFFDISDANFTLQPAPPIRQVTLANASVVEEDCVPGDGAIDPGETVTVNFTLRNTGNVTASNLVATLVTSAGVLFPSAAQNYGRLEPGGTVVTRPFTLVGGGTCGDTVRATLQLQAGAESFGVVTQEFTLGPVTSLELTNPSRLLIPASGKSGKASLYPSQVSVSGVSGRVSKITVTLLGLSHTGPADLDILLVSPSGEKAMLMSDAGGLNPVNNATLTFDDAASSTLPNSGPIVSGTFRPTDYGTGDSFPSPAPSGPYSASFSAFQGLDPNGTWSLFINDDLTSNTGSLEGGWRLTITAKLESECCHSAGSADLALTMAATPKVMNLGDSVTYTLTCTNQGPNTATHVRIIDTLPDGVVPTTISVSQGSCTNRDGAIFCHFGSIPNGGRATLSFVIRTPAFGSLINRAAVTTTTRDPDPANNAASVLVQVAAPPVGSITITDGAARIAWSAIAGLRYRVQYSSNLDDQSWQDLPGEVTATSSTAELVDTNIGTAPQRFYRIVVVPGG